MIHHVRAYAFGMGLFFVDATGFEPSKRPPDVWTLCVPRFARAEAAGSRPIGLMKKEPMPSAWALFSSMRQDLNLRPLRPERSALPN